MYQFQPNIQPGRLSDQTIAGACLEDCKSLAVRSTMAAAESASTQLRNTLADMARSDLQMAEELYRWLNQQGAYITPQAPQPFIQQVQQQFQPVGGTVPAWR